MADRRDYDNDKTAQGDDLSKDTFTDRADWLQDIGPDDPELRDTVVDQIEGYGFDRMDENDMFDEPDYKSPDMMGDDEPDEEIQAEIGELQQHNASRPDFRSMEDEVLDAVDEGREPDDGESIPADAPPRAIK